MKNNGNFAISDGRSNKGLKLEVFLPAFYG